jgi:hypothetical protein
MLKGEPKEVQAAVTAEIMASAKASGIEPAELNRLFNSESLMRNAVFQRMMYDAGKYRLMMKARDAAAAKPLPPVQRPGTARTPGNSRPLRATPFQVFNTALLRVQARRQTIECGIGQWNLQNLRYFGNCRRELHKKPNGTRTMKPRCALTKR